LCAVHWSISTQSLPSRMARLAFTHSFQAVRPFLRRLSSFTHHTDSSSDHTGDCHNDRKRTRSSSRGHRRSKDFGSDTTLDTSHSTSSTAASKLRTECSNDLVSSTASTFVSGHDDSSASVSPPPLTPSSTGQVDTRPEILSIEQDSQSKATKDLSSPPIAHQIATSTQDESKAEVSTDATESCPILTVKLASPTISQVDSTEPAGVTT
jgi:hypothetical protein